MRYATVLLHYYVHLTQLAVDILTALEGCGHLRFTEAVSQLFSQPIYSKMGAISQILDQKSFFWNRDCVMTNQGGSHHG